MKQLIKFDIINTSPVFEYPMYVCYAIFNDGTTDKTYDIGKMNEYFKMI